MPSKLTVFIAAGITAVALPSAAQAGVTINIDEVGNNVIFTAAGTFDRTLSTKYVPSPVSTSFDFVNPAGAVVEFGSAPYVFPNFPTSDFFNATGPLSFGSDFGQTIDNNVGVAIAIGGNDSAFGISQKYINNSQIISFGSISDATLSSAGLTSGVYNYLVGGNTLTVNIGQSVPAVPENGTWLTMILGMGAVGFAMRRRKSVTTRVTFA